MKAVVTALSPNHRRGRQMDSQLTMAIFPTTRRPPNELRNQMFNFLTESLKDHHGLYKIVGYS